MSGLNIKATDALPQDRIKMGLATKMEMSAWPRHLALVFIDRFTRNCFGDDSEREALIQLTLNEPIDSREIVVEVNCP